MWKIILDRPNLILAHAQFAQRINGSSRIVPLLESNNSKLEIALLCRRWLLVLAFNDSSIDLASQISPARLSKRINLPDKFSIFNRVAPVYRSLFESPPHSKISIILEQIELFPVYFPLVRGINVNFEFVKQSGTLLSFVDTRFNTYIFADRNNDKWRGEIDARRGLINRR